MSAHRSRRDLLLLGLGTAAGLLAGCRAPAPPPPLEPTAGAEKAVLVAEGMH